MRIMKRASLAALAFAMAGVLGAGEQIQVPETRRIGVVFIQQVFKNYEYAKATEDRLRTTFMPDQQRIEAEIVNVQEMERALQNNPLTPSGSAQWRRKMMEIETKKVEIQSMQEEFGKRVRDEEAAFWQNMYNAFQRACRILAEYYKYDIIIAAPDPALSEEAVQAMDPMAIQQEILMRRIQYVNDSANLTKSITDLLNHRYQQHLQDPQKNSL
ncbi:MAG: OmpH family outer membrane protein [Planctomycetota bacterium]|jgi:Skp family chaperone for outer membrane proteins|nr:OmpH family outer membrane protein [Planctomycetota bacterium]